MESSDFDFDRPILGLFYSRPGVQLFIGRGAKGAAGGVGDMELVDTSINVFGMASPFSGGRDSGLEVIFPYGLHSGFRRLTIRDGSTSSDTFEATVIAIGAGAGLQRGIGATRFLVRAMPAFGLASRSFGFGNGTSTLVDIDAELTFGPIAGRLGLALGYQYRWQKWKMEEDFVDDRDYSGTQHGFRLGVFW